MRLSKRVVETISDKRSREAKAIRFTLALALNFTEYWVGVCIRQNKEDGPLTTVKAVDILKKSLDLDQSEILEEGDRVPA